MDLKSCINERFSSSQRLDTVSSWPLTWYDCSVEHNWISIYHYNNGEVLETDISDPYSENLFDTKSKNVVEQLSNSIWNTSIHTDGQLAPKWENLYNPSCKACEIMHQKRLSAADKWASWTSWLQYSLRTASLCIRKPDWLFFVRISTHVCAQYPDTKSARNLTVQHSTANRVAISCNISLFNWACFRFAKRCSILTYKSTVIGTNRAYEGSRRKMHGCNTEEVQEWLLQKVLQEVQIHVKDGEFMNCPQRAAFASDSSKEFDQKWYDKLVWHTTALNKVTEVQLHTVVIDQNGTVNKVAVDRVIPVQKSTKDAR